MQKLLETIKIADGQPQYLTFHNQRLNKARQTLFQATDVIDLHEVIKNPPQQGIYRCRVIYGKQIDSVTYHLYREKPYKRFKIVAADELRYDFKYLDRSALDILAVPTTVADDIFIVKQGLITDTTIANIAIWRENRWLTPERPLLQGTTRVRLLAKGQIMTAPITPAILKEVSRLAIMNALIGFRVLEQFEFV